MTFPTLPVLNSRDMDVVSEAKRPFQDDESRTWDGWRLAGALESPEPEAPQGEYAIDLGVGKQVALLPAIGGESRPAELLAPAGGPDAGYAALHYGADAIYLGLKKFSARAEAENFTLDEVDEITAYAHSLEPRRRVFVTINTVIRQDELSELIDDVAGLAAIGVDAIILQDLGVYGLLKRHFPDLELHGSTQLAVHDRSGAETARQLGFRRVVLARELTFEEVHDVTAEAGVETEVFVHGALCYSYSGLCLFSSQTLGRSGNRGQCAYSCRDAFQITGAPATLRDGSSTKRDPRHGFPFSMKDLALPDHLPSLRAAGVSCFKIEGRKKSPLYVATTTHYYRDLLDGRLVESERADREADLQAVFSRPWTKLFVDSHKDKEVADRDTVGHRGTSIGTVDSVRNVGGAPRIRFRSRRAIERHDGLQIDLPKLGKPFGFAVDRLWILHERGDGSGRESFEAPAGALIEVGLPDEYPAIPRGAPVYCASSQAVKREFRFSRPKPGAFRRRTRVDMELVLTPDKLTATSGETTVTLAGPFTPARDPSAFPEAARGAFAKLGDTRFELGAFSVRNDDRLFVPVSALNQLRRELAQELERAFEDRQRRRVEHLKSELLPRDPPREPSSSRGEFRWSIKVDRIGFLDRFEPADWEGIDEVIIDIARDHATTLSDRLEQLASQLGRDRLRLALPPLSRAWEEKGLRHKLDKFLASGWKKWEAANLSAWSKLGLDPTASSQPLDVAADWSLYVVNRLAARQLLDMGVTRFALSPEDGLENWRSLLAEFGSQATVIVHQDTPLFLAESCAYANLIGGCPGKANCKFESMEMLSSHGERVTALDYHCRTIVLNQGPYCLSPHLSQLAAAGATSLRADFIYRPSEPSEVVERWRAVRAGQPITGGHAANFRRGLQ